MFAFKTGSNLIVYGGGTLLVKADGQRNDRFQVGGTVCRFMAGSRIRIEAVGGASFAVGDELTVFTPSSRKPVVPENLSVESNDGSVWSAAKLAAEGKLVCTAATGIHRTTADGSLPVRVYTLDGKLIATGIDADHALRGLPRGVYIVGARKLTIP